MRFTESLRFYRNLAEMYPELYVIEGVILSPVKV